MSKLVTNFGDSNTTGNTTLQQNLTVQGAFSTFSGNILTGSAFSTLGNSTNKFNTIFSASTNVTTLNVTAIYGTTGFVGIGTTGGGATLNVAGNVWASNALTAPNVFATVSMNALTANTANIFGPLGIVGINMNPAVGGSNLQVSGNLYASTNITATNVFASTSLNVTGVTNTSAIFGTSGSVGVGVNAGTTGGATLNVAGNAFISNSLVSPNVFALTSMNTPTTNTLSLYGPAGFVGVGTSGSGATLTVAGNVWASNALSAPTVLATVSMNVTGQTNTSAIFSPTGFVGIGVTGSGATLTVAGNVWASNTLSAPTINASVSMNVTGQTNTSAIFSPTGFVGIGVTGSGATLTVAGNVWASNAISTPNIFASLSNITTLNVSYLSGTTGTVGIGTVASGPALFVAGNLYASNAVTAPNAIVTVMNISSILNTQTIFSSTGLLGINTSTALGASLHVLGNVYASNALTAPLVAATVSMNTPTLNTTSVYGLASLVGINTTVPAASLHVVGNIYASNALTAPIVYATTSMNITTLNTTSIYGTSGSVGIGTTLPTAALQVQGNMYATNAISTTNIFATTLNTTVINTASIFGVSGLVGVGGTPLGSTLDVTGNIYASNAITSPNIISTTSNITTLNTTSIYSTAVGVGINTTATGAGVMVGGNLYASNALTGTNIIATGTIYYGEDLFKRSPYLVASVANAVTIQTWISATCNAADQPGSFWAMSSAPAYGNIAAGPQGSSDYHGSVLLPDGRVLFVPRNASNVGIFNPATGLFSSVTPTGLAATADKFAGGVLLPNGNVVFVPYQSANIGMYNPAALTYSNILAVAAPSATLFKGGILAPNGNVIFTPQSSGNVGVFNPTLATYSNLGPLGIGATAFSGAILLPSGNVVFVPASSANIGMYNTYSMTAATAYINIGPIPASGYDGGVLAPNGNVIFIQNTASNVGVYNPSILTAAGLSNVGPTNVGAGAFAGGCLTPSGNVVMAPYATGNVGLFDPTGLVYTNVYQSTAGSTKFTGATQLPDGRVVFCPYGASNVGLLNTMVPVGPEFCLAPYFNKY